jgi:hypothetical protein
MLRARAAPICAWRGDLLRSAARNCGCGEERGRRKRRGRARFWTLSIAIYRSRWGRMGAPATAMRTGGPMQGLICVKKDINPQIGSGGGIQADIGGLLELLLVCRKKSILNLELIEVRRNEPSTPNPCRLYPKLVNPGLKQTLELFATLGKKGFRPGLLFTLTDSGTHMSDSSLSPNSSPIHS